MSYLLHIESTSTVCSVVISKNKTLLFLKEINNGYTHAENLHIFITDVLKEASLNVKDLAAICVSNGPGSYTGLRIGFSAAKGLAYALHIPLITIDTLQALTASVIDSKNLLSVYCPLIDARRMEVYTAIYDYNLIEIMPVCALVLSEENISVFKTDMPIIFFGDGMPKAKLILQTLPNSTFIDGITSTAKAMIELGYKKFLAKDFVNVAYCEPNYLKEFFFTASKK